MKQRSPIKRRRHPGGVRSVGCKGTLRSLGKYGAGMKQHCQDCGGPHQAAVQATDAELKAFMADFCQLEGSELERKIKQFHGEFYTAISRFACMLGGGAHSCRGTPYICCMKPPTVIVLHHVVLLPTC